MNAGECSKMDASLNIGNACIPINDYRLFSVTICMSSAWAEKNTWHCRLLGASVVWISYGWSVTMYAAKRDSAHTEIGPTTGVINGKWTKSFYLCVPHVSDRGVPFVNHLTEHHAQHDRGGGISNPTSGFR